ncbi:MAG: ABC transporter permease [Streptosporangiaceae bacterium]
MTGAAAARRPRPARQDGASGPGSGVVAGVHAEWTKLRTAPGTAWALLAVVAATVALGAVADLAARCPQAGCRLDPARTALTGIYLSQAIVVVLAAASVGGEYGSGMITVTLAAMPRRTAVLAAKAVTVTGPVLLAGAVAVAGSLLAGRVILPGRGFTGADGSPVLAAGDPVVLRAAAGSVLYLALIGLLSLGVTAAARSTAAGVGIVLGLLYVVPVAAAVVTAPSLHRHLEQFAPMTAGMDVQATTGLGSLPLSPWAGLGVLAVWAAGALVLGGLALRCRDA